MTNLTVNVSVIIPCFNNQETIERALISVEHQTVRPLEVLVIDDNSTDKSREVVQNLIENTELDLRLIALSLNGGPARARNMGWGQAKGEYIALLDADDAWHPRKLELQCQLMVADQSIDMSGHTFEVATDKEEPFLVHAITSVDYSALRMQFKNPFHTSSVMIKKNIEERFCEQKRYCEDYLLWLQILLNGGRAVLIDKPLSRMFKAPYGEKGLSAQIHKMQKAELNVYSQLLKQGYISRSRHLQAVTFSCLKYVRRWFITNIKRTAL